MSNQHNEVVELTARVARLEAMENVRGVMLRYAYLVDIRYLDELAAEVLAPDIALHLINFPPGEQGDVELVGSEEVKAFYFERRPVAPLLAGGHNLTNLNVSVNDAADEAEASAYFLFTGTPERAVATGGLYQARFAPFDGQWKIVEMNIVTTWGWLPTATESVTDPVDPSRAWRGGRPTL